MKTTLSEQTAKSAERGLLSYRRTTCRLCDQGNLELVLKLQPTPIADAYVSKEQLEIEQPSFPLDLLLCTNCGYIFIADIVSAQALYKDFLYVTASSPGLGFHFKNYADQVVPYIKPSQGDLVVDVGSNDGTLLANFKRHGLNVLGVDPALEIAKQASDAGIFTIPDYFTLDCARKIKNKNGLAKIITANNVIANIDDLNAFIPAVKELLAPDGFFIFETGYLLDLVNNKVFDNIYHEHLSYFSATALNYFFDRHDMKLVDIRRVETKGGSLRGFVVHKGIAQKIEKSVAGLLEVEQKWGVREKTPYQNLFNELEVQKKQIQKFLFEIKKRGQTLAGYGASPSTTTFLFYFGLQDYLSFIVDDNPLKHNRFSPGYHFPVYPSEMLYEQKPDYVVILAWRFADVMVKRHQKFLQQGGKFIKVLPKVELVKGDLE